MHHNAVVPPLSIVNVAPGRNTSKVKLAADMDGRRRVFTVRVNGNFVKDVQADDINRYWLDHQIDPHLKQVCSDRAIEALIIANAGSYRGR